MILRLESTILYEMEYKQLSGREFPRFSGIKTYFRLPHVAIDSDYDVGIVGVPFDGGTSYRPGARFSPSKIRDTSSLGRGFHWSREVNVFNTIKVADLGDCSVVPMSIEKTYKKIEAHFSTIIQNKKRFIAVGGDHSITLPLLRAISKTKKEKINMIHFDAHFDTYPAAWDCEYHHGTFLRHAIEEGLIETKNSIQIGMRGPFVDSNDVQFSEKHGIKVFNIDEVRKNGVFEFIKKLPPFEKGLTYISFDVDCLDPAFAPGTGTPVPGGLTTYETQQILRALKVKNLIGADVVEVCPPFDVSEITQLAAVDTIFEFMCLMALART